MQHQGPKGPQTVMTELELEFAAPPAHMDGTRLGIYRKFVVELRPTVYH